MAVGNQRDPAGGRPYPARCACLSRRRHQGLRQGLLPGAAGLKAKCIAQAVIVVAPGLAVKTPADAFCIAQRGQRFVDDAAVPPGQANQLVEEVVPVILVAL